MRCAICGKTTKELRSDLCFRCYVISRAIRLEPDMPKFVSVKPTSGQQKHSGFVLKPFVTDLRAYENDQ